MIFVLTFSFLLTGCSPPIFAILMKILLSTMPLFSTSSPSSKLPPVSVFELVVTSSSVNSGSTQLCRVQILRAV